MEKGYQIQENAGFFTVENKSGPVLGMGELKIKERDGFAFKNLSGQDDLLPYEDWRLDAETRAKDMVAHLPLKQQAGLVLNTLWNTPLSMTREGAKDEQGNIVPAKVFKRYDHRQTPNELGDNTVLHNISRLHVAVCAALALFGTARHLTAKAHRLLARTLFNDLFKPVKRAAAIVKAVANWQDADILAQVSTGLGKAMVGINADEIKIIMAERGQ